MTEEAGKFVALMIRPFGDNLEARALAGHELEEGISTAAPEALAVASARLEKPRLPGWTKWLGLAAWILVAGLYALLVHSAQDLRYRVEGLPGNPSSSAHRTRGRIARENNMFSGLTRDQDSLLFSGALILRKKRLDDPAILAEYAVSQTRGEKTPPDFMAEARRLDPENAWFPAFQGGSAAEGAVERVKGLTRTDPPTWRILDQGKLDRALDWAREAAKLPRFNSHEGELLSARIALLPQPRSVLEQTIVTGYVAAVSTGDRKFRNLADCFSAQTQVLEKAGDAGALKALIADWKSYMTLYLNCPDFGPYGALLKSISLKQGATDFGRAAAALGLEPEHEEMTGLAGRLEESIKANRRATFPSEVASHASSLSGVVVGGSVPAPDKDIPTLADVKPGRVAEHELFWGVFSAVASVLLVAGVIGLWLFRLRAGPLRATLAAEMNRIMTFGDAAWIILGGVVLPFLAMEAMVRITPLAGWDWGLSTLRGLRPAMAMLLLLWMLLMLPVLIGRWRIGRRLGFAGIHWKRSWLNWVVLVLLFGMLLSGIWTVQADGPGSTGMVVAGVFAAVALLSLTVTSIRTIFSKSQNLLKRIILVRMIRPAWALGALLMMAGCIFSQNRETWWTRQDRLLQLDPAEPSLTRTEYRATQALHARLLEIWNSTH